MPCITVGRHLPWLLALASALSTFACSPTDNAQPRASTAPQGGSAGGLQSSAGGQRASGGVAATGGIPAPAGSATGGSSTTASAGLGGNVASGGSTGGTLAVTGGNSGGGAIGAASNSGAAGAVKGGAGGTSGGGASSGGEAGVGKGGAGGTSDGVASGKGGAGAAGASAGSGGAADGAGASSCPGFVLCDSFEDGNLTANPSWLSSPNSFSVVDDGGSKVLKQQASSEAWAYSGVGTWTDVTIFARVKVLDFMGTSSTNCGGIVARWQGSSNPNYMASMCAKGTVGIYKDGDLVDETNGTKSITLAVNVWHTLKFRVAGKPGSVSLSLTIDDMPLISVIDTDTSTPVEAGYVALGSKKAISMEYDDIQVSTP